MENIALAARGPDGGPSDRTACLELLAQDEDPASSKTYLAVKRALEDLRQTWQIAPLQQAHEAGGEPLTLAEIEANFASGEGYTPSRATLTRRLANAGVQPIERPGITTAAYRRCEVEAALFASDGLRYRPKRSSPVEANSEFKTEVLEAIETCTDAAEQQRLLKLIRAFLERE